jgi:predicted enzyme related to lactoylglutathione lyase
MMALPSGTSHWLVYFTAADLDEAAEVIEREGGAVMVPAMVIQSGRILVARDPQGAYFALFEGAVDP